MTPTRNRRDEQGREGQPCEIGATIRLSVGSDIGTVGIERAMGDIDDAQHTKNEAETDRHEKKTSAA